MNAGREPRTLPIRRWMALALLVTFLVPACTTIAFAVASVRENPRNERARAVAYLRDGASEWADPAWQEAARARLAQDDIAFILVMDGRELYRSADDPLIGQSKTHNTRVVQRVIISHTDGGQFAYVYFNEDSGPPDAIPVELLPVIAIIALGLTLAGIGWFVGRTVLSPLAATNAAAMRVADGDLNVTLPRSRVREVSEVNDTFEAMSAALRSSLEERAEMEQERRLFIGAVAHDLRTPLFTLRGYLEGLESGVASTPEQRAHYIAVAREKADALERLISDLFDFSRLEYLEQTPNREPLDLTDLLRKIVADIQPLANAKPVSVAVSANAEPCRISGDIHLLTRAIENLIDNALRFTPAGGQIQIDCAQTATDVQFTIRDGGPGIASDDLPHIFTPLYRAESSRNRRTGGAGLGLTIARRILLAHGGDLTAANHPEGGAVFTGKLPIAPPLPR